MVNEKQPSSYKNMLLSKVKYNEAFEIPGRLYVLRGVTVI